MAKQEFTVQSTATPADTNCPAGMKVRLAPNRKYLQGQVRVAKNFGFCLQYIP